MRWRARAGCGAAARGHVAHGGGVTWRGGVRVRAAARCCMRGLSQRAGRAAVGDGARRRRGHRTAAAPGMACARERPRQRRAVALTAAWRRPQAGQTTSSHLHPTRRRCVAALGLRCARACAPPGRRTTGRCGAPHTTAHTATPAAPLLWAGLRGRARAPGPARQAAAERARPRRARAHGAAAAVAGGRAAGGPPVRVCAAPGRARPRGVERGGLRG